MKSVAIIGAGPGGLVAARFLKSEGFRTTIFDQCARIGGQWAGDPEHSAIWPNMRTNTSRLMTSFSDLRPDLVGPAFVSGEDVRGYLDRYAGQLALHPDLRLKHRVTLISRQADGKGFTVRYVASDGTPEISTFSHVVVASGRYRHPTLAPLAGLDSFTGAGGVLHSFHYRSSEAFRGQRVLVVGGGVSALEIASELAQSGTAHTLSSCRQQRYILNKVIAGVPVDQFVMTRYAALSAERLPVRAVCDQLKDLILRTSGDPRTWGALSPVNNILEAGVTLNQGFLALVSDGRIDCRPAVRSVSGRTVRFADGSEAIVDAIVLATGYRLRLPFLSLDLQSMLGQPEDRLMLFKQTFHPDAPGLAFLGFYDLMGPFLPVVELQARWIAYSWSDAPALACREHMLRNLAPCSAIPMQAAALTFAREAGVEPDLDQFPALRRALLFGPLAPASFRLTGRDRLPYAADLVAQDAGRYQPPPGTGSPEPDLPAADTIPLPANSTINAQNLTPVRLSARIL
jgi:cation diffusion facilitator CzcD-associated flavoprotein CzcO